MYEYPNNINDLLCRILTPASKVTSLDSAYSNHVAVMYHHNLMRPLTIPITHFLKSSMPAECSVYSSGSSISDGTVLVYRPANWFSGELAIKPAVTRSVLDIFRDWLLEPMPETILVRTACGAITDAPLYNVYNLPVDVFGEFNLSFVDDDGIERMCPCISSWQLCPAGTPRYKFLYEMNRELSERKRLNPLSQESVLFYHGAGVLFREGTHAIFCSIPKVSDLSMETTRIRRTAYLYADFFAVLSSVVGYTALPKHELLLLLHGPVAFSVFDYTASLSGKALANSSVILDAYILSRLSHAELDMLEKMLNQLSSFNGRFRDGLVLDTFYLPSLQSKSYSSNSKLCDTVTLYKTCKLLYSQLGLPFELVEGGSVNAVSH